MKLALIFDKLFVDMERQKLLNEIENFKRRYNDDCINQYITLRALKDSKGVTEVFINQSGVICLFDIYNIKTDITMTLE